MFLRVGFVNYMKAHVDAHACYESWEAIHTPAVGFTFGYIGEEEDNCLLD